MSNWCSKRNKDQLKVIHQKKRKKVQYGDEIFPSGLEFGRAVGLEDHRSAYKIIKDGKYKGISVKYIN